MTTRHDQTAQPGTPKTNRERRSGRWRRAAGVGLVTVLLSVATVPATATTATDTASRVSPRVTLADWPGAEWGSGQSPYDQDQLSNPWGSSNGPAATVDSAPATAAESTGVVLIDTVLDYQGATGAGTGIVLTSDGEVLTNYHVIEGATSITVTVATTGQTYRATVVGHDESEDVALLHLEGAERLDTAVIDDDRLARGDDVTAVGNAGGTDSLTAADGVVTALSTTITTTEESGAVGETLDGLIETDADVVAGDSGGPLIDGEGEVVGINTAASTGTVINGYAIPVHDALAVVQQIRSGNETSTVQIGASAFLGVEVTSGSSAPGALDTGTGTGYDYEGAGTSWQGQTAGALVAGLVDDSPAVAAGLEVGDTITAVDGSPVGSADDLSSLLDTHDAGDLVELTWTDSQGGAHSESVTLAASPVA